MCSICMDECSIYWMVATRCYMTLLFCFTSSSLSSVCSFHLWRRNYVILLFRILARVKWNFLLTMSLNETLIACNKILSPNIFHSPILWTIKSTKLELLTNRVVDQFQFSAIFRFVFVCSNWPKNGSFSFNFSWNLNDLKECAVREHLFSSLDLVLSANTITIKKNSINLRDALHRNLSCYLEGARLLFVSVEISIWCSIALTFYSRATQRKSKLISI